MKRALAGIATVALGLGALVLGSATAATAAPGDAVVVTVVKPDGTPVAAGEVVPEGTPLKLRIQYQKQAAPNDLTGETVNVDLTAGGTRTGYTVPAGNTAVDNVALAGANGIDISFVTPWPGDINQGYLDLDFTVDSVLLSGGQDIEWEIDGQPGKLTIIVQKTGDEFENIGSESYDKARTTPANLNGYVNVGPSPTDPNETVFLGLDASIINQPITYTLTVEVPDGTVYDAANPLAIADQLDEGLSYVAGSFAATLTTWDANGMNQDVNPFAFAPTINPAAAGTGESFTSQSQITGPAILTVTYQATIADEASRVLVEDALRAEANGLGGNSGNFSHTLTNTATFGPNAVTDTADISMQGTIPGPCTTGCNGGLGFGKTGTGASVNVITDAAGQIVDENGAAAPVDVTYTLRANLHEWDGHNSNYTLDRNVVISDTLVSQLTWKTADADFLTLTATAGAANGTTPIAALTEVACPAVAPGATAAQIAEAFNGDAYIGNYCIDGQRILINIGKDRNTNVSIDLEAQLHSVDGLTPRGTSTILGATRYELPNQAQFWHRNGARANANNNQYPVKLPDDRSQGLNDTAAFTKAGPAGSVSVAPGDRAFIPYIFTVNTGVAGVSATDARIVDRIDTSVFDMSDLTQIGIASTYTGAGDVSSRVELSFVNGELVIELADGAPLQADGTWVVTLQIPTYPLDGKETIDVTNYATLFGTGTEPLYWSEDDSRATSFGDELEVRKHVFDRGVSDWTKVLVAPEDGDGDLIDNVYVYRLQLIAHGSFAGPILSVHDMLPAATQFLGFVDAADVATGGPVIPGNTIALSHGIEAIFDPAAGVQGEITVQQASGGIPVGGEVVAYFAVQVDPDQPEVVVNSFGTSQASIVPGGPSIDIEKWIDEGESPQYDQRGRLLNDGFKGDHDSAPGKSLTANKSETIHFTVSNDGPEPLIDIEVGDQLDSGAGAITGLVCTFPDASTGTTWAGPFAVGTQFECTGTLPALKSGQTHANTAWVTGVGATSGIQVGDADEWHGRVPTQLESTGGQALTGLAVLAGIGILGGGLLMLARRRKTVADS